MTVAQATEVPGGLDYLAARGHLTRLAVEAALALIGMWQADPKATTARHGVTDADDALEQVDVGRRPVRGQGPRDSRRRQSGRQALRAAAQ